MMKTFLLATTAIILSLGFMGAAHAQYGGCPQGYYFASDGRCYPQSTQPYSTQPYYQSTPDIYINPGFSFGFGGHEHEHRGGDWDHHGHDGDHHHH